MPSPKLPPLALLDTVGAGDRFVGNFGGTTGPGRALIASDDRWRGRRHTECVASKGTVS